MASASTTCNNNRPFSASGFHRFSSVYILPLQVFTIHSQSLLSLHGIFPKNVKMHYSAIFVSLFAAASAVASGQRQDSSKSVTVTLRNDSEKPFVFSEPVRRPVSARPNIAEPISKVELTLTEDVQNANLRCQILDQHQEPIVVLRGNSTDITFADGGKGPWTLREPAVVNKVICDSNFVKIETDDERLGVKVLLQSQNPELGVNFDLSGARASEVEVREDTAFGTVTLDITGELVDPELRCQIVSADGPIVVLRGENVDVTFADGDKGPWTLQQETIVQRIICDPAFKKASA